MLSKVTFNEIIDMSDDKYVGIGFFEKYLTVWVALCMVAGILIGKFIPSIPEFLGKLEYA